MIGQMTRKWSDQLPRSAGLANAGKWIGILERILILTFLLQDQYAAIGLLITAKGLLRFSEKDKQEEKTEYVLIGSLISFSVSVITGIVVKNLTA
jgi:xanthine/uracil/vitamin C permease (AzgA family)